MKSMFTYRDDDGHPLVLTGPDVGQLLIGATALPVMMMMILVAMMMIKLLLSGVARNLQHGVRNCIFSGFTLPIS